MKQQKSISVVWFKRDLRVVDHRPLYEASLHGPVLPLLVIEPGFWAQPDVSSRQYLFFAECCEELSRELAGLGQPLVVRIGEVADILDDLSRQFSIEGLYSHEETGNGWTYERDLRVHQWCRDNSILWHEFRQHGVTRRLKSRNGWSKTWDLRMAEPVSPVLKVFEPLPSSIDSKRFPTWRQLKLAADDPPLLQKGGRNNALETLDSFLKERGEYYRFEMSSPLTAEKSCSRLSPYLAWGAVSMREVAQATRKQQVSLKAKGDCADANWRKSLTSFSGRLHWHCHFMQKLEDEPALEFNNLHSAYDQLRRPEESDLLRLQAWSKGETGLPFVDACMRYLNATGWLNFRMRAMLMAVASYHLWLHWREPGLHLARQFVDYEPGIHWPQVQMQSGTTGINAVRIYNPVKQGYDQDPQGDFVRRWVPELASIDGPLIHEPWKSAEAGSILNKTYPFPIVDHMSAAREARQKIYGLRAGQHFRKTANSIQDKHGSRKSGTPKTGRRKSKSAKKKDAIPSKKQMSLDL